MTAEREVFVDYPKSIDETLTRKDFQLLSPQALLTTLSYVGWEPKLRRDVVDFYVRYIAKSYFIFNRGKEIEAEVLNDVSHGNSTRIRYLSPLLTYPESTTLGWLVLDASRHFNEWFFKFSSFVLVCERYCIDDRQIFGENNLMRKTPTQNPVLRSFNFWFVKEPNFDTLRFSKFLGNFAQSGLNELLISQFRKSQHLRILYNLKDSWRNGLRNGNIFSYVFLAEKTEKTSNENYENPTKISAFYGTFIIAALFLIFAFIVLICEFSVSCGFYDRFKMKMLHGYVQLFTIVSLNTYCRILNLITLKLLQ
ncbi:unnamed protein product [Orchesella dallaii]|uniref:Uncharacterized protein n=1 Tax=Orchesella dallaii TaxID=48710 RepID=A0ABP1RP29_9HEXA